MVDRTKARALPMVESKIRARRSNTGRIDGRDVDALQDAGVYCNVIWQSTSGDLILYVGGTFVGGCNDGGIGGVMPLYRSGKLQSLLTEAGAL